jgi:integrase
MKLTEYRIERLSVEPGRKDMLVFDGEQRGLAVRVSKNGGKSFLCQYTLNGHKRRVPLGSCDALSLAGARSAASAIIGDVAKGKDPAADRKLTIAAERARRDRERLTLRALITDWEREHLSTRRTRYAAEAVRALNHAFADHLDTPAEDLDRAAVVRALDALKRRQRAKGVDGTHQRKGVAIVGRTAAYGRAAFSWAIKRGVLSDNPFSMLPIAARVAARERVLSDVELGEVWRAAGKMSRPYGCIVRLLILTGARKSEVAGMTWAEFSDDLTTWTVPAERAKNGVPHLVPLNKPARDLLRGLLPDDDADARRVLRERKAAGALVLPGLKGTPFEGWSKAKRALDDEIVQARTDDAVHSGHEPEQLSGFRLHDLRRTLATGFQRLGVRLEVTEAVLNHVSGTRAGIVGVYQRHDWAAEKRVALDAWAKHVLACAEKRDGGDNVVRLNVA